VTTNPSPLLSAPRIGLGCWRLAGPGRPPRPVALATIAAAYEAGARVFDTADSYGIDQEDEGYGEAILAEALAGVDDAAVITKGGFRRPGGVWEHAGDPSWLAKAVEASIERLGRGPLDCYLLHGVDPRFDVAASIEPIAAAQEAGLIKSIGVSNVSAAELARCRAVAPVTVVQNRLSVTLRPAGWRAVFDIAAGDGLTYMPHTPFGPTPEVPDERLLPWNNPAVTKIAAEHQVTAAVVALAWLLGLGRNVLVVPGARRPESIVDSLRAPSFKLSEAEFAELSQLPAAQ